MASSHLWGPFSEAQTRHGVVSLWAVTVLISWQPFPSLPPPGKGLLSVVARLDISKTHTGWGLQKRRQCLPPHYTIPGTLLTPPSLGNGTLGQLSGGSGLICLCFHCNTYMSWVATAHFQPWVNGEQKRSQEKEVGLRLLWKQGLVIPITTFKNQCPWAPTSPQLCQQLYCQLY